MFSYKKIDEGSKLLATFLKNKITGEVADLCSGWGYLSVTTLQNNSKIKSISPEKTDGQYCFVKVVIKQKGDEIIKEEILECADGKKGIDTPGYWELFAQFYYRDIYAPEYCRYYSREGHAFKTPGKVCLNVNGEWEVK